MARLLALVETERRYYQDLFSILPVIVGIANDDLRVVAANRAFRRRFDLPAGDISLIRLREVFPHTEVETTAARVIETGEPAQLNQVTVGGTEWNIHLQRTYSWQEGDTPELLITAVESFPASQGAPDKPAPALEMLPDVQRIVDRKRREALERLSSQVAHVANNLLMVIGGYAEELRDSFGPADSRRSDVDEIVGAAQRLGRLTEQLNALTRQPAGESYTFDASAWSEQALPRIASQLSPDCTLRLSPGTGIVGATGDPALLETTLIALLKLVEPTDAVISVSRTNGEALIRTALPGLRLDEEARDRLLEPFPGHRDRRGESMLGLTLHSRALFRMGAWISWEGSYEEDPVFVIHLPASEKGVDLAPAETTELGSVVLLLEDEPGIRALVRKTLRRQGFEVLEASDVPEALNIASRERERIDLLIADVMVPGGDGLSTAAEISGIVPALSVLLISGHERLAETDNRLPPNTAFLAKPFSLGELLEQVRRLTAGKLRHASI